MGVPYAGYAFAASGGTHPLRWTESGSLPPGLAFSASGQLSGKPATAGIYPFSVSVTDSSMPPLMANAPVSLKINDSAIVISSATLPTGTASYPYPGFGFSASGGSPPYTWQSSGMVPPGLKVGNNGTVSGTPTQAGSFSFSVTATDSAHPPGSSAPLTTHIVISSPIALTLNATPAPPAGVDKTPYGPFRFNATGGFLPLHWSITAGNLPPGVSIGSDGSLTGTPTSAGTFTFTVTVTDSAPKSVSSSLPFTINVTQVPPPPTGSMAIPRSGHAATLLFTGDVLVTGGGRGQPDATAELYHPLTGTFTGTTGNMTEPRSGHTATLLGGLSNANRWYYGMVLIVGSVNATAELYDPARRIFSATGSMHHARTSPTATLIGTGQVLIVGGNTNSGDQTAELYDPASGEFFDTGSTTMPRTGHTATLLDDGHVLISGGNGAAGETAELYDPVTRSFTKTTGGMTKPRAGHTATLLERENGSQTQNGFVLIVGTDGSADLYNPNTATFASVGGDTIPRSAFTASLQNDATVLVAGGYATDPSCNLPNSLTAATVFTSISDAFTVTGGLNTARDTHTATVLYDGRVLVIGGTRHTASHPVQNSCQTTGTVLSSTELLAPAGLRTYTLTGYCFGPVFNTYDQCGLARDTAQCPAGQPAVIPRSLNCRFGGYPVDASTTCRAKGLYGQSIGGACVIQ
jgi:hypothetical protein